MRNVNLIPLRRRLARRRRAHLRWCAAGCVAYALAAAAGAAIAWNAWAGHDPSVARQIARAESDIRRDEQELVNVRASLVEQQKRLAAAREIAEQPDWGTLLALLADKSDDRMVLRSCRLQPAADLAAHSRTTDAPAPEGLVVVVTGVARSPQSAQQYVLRLEQTRLFDRVTLVDTRREPFLDGEASAFRVDCLLSAAEAPRGAAVVSARENP